MIKIAIIEDEPATARNLKYLLEENHKTNILATLDSVSASIDWLKENKKNCDLLFMDIRLNDGLSFEIFEKIELHVPVIFVTAYNEFALDAFKANGIDYVLKPFSEEEIAKAIEKFQMLKQPSQTTNNADLLKVIQQIKSQTNYRKSFLIHYRDKLIPLNVADVNWFTSENEILSAATVSGKFYTLEGTLEKLQSELDPSIFFRANRQYIVNKKSIAEVNFYFNGRLALKVFPEPKENILISKARVPEFKEWMNM